VNDSVSTPTAQFVINHLTGDGDFKAGFRPNSLYRDLGVAAATHGLAIAHVVRNARPFPSEGVEPSHRHDVQFQFCYVLKGWQKMRFDGVGEVIAREGTAWLQPSGVVHEVLDYSDDREILEVVLPAKYASEFAPYSNLPAAD
jgi:hypothetical protein